MISSQRYFFFISYGINTYTMATSGLSNDNCLRELGQLSTIIPQNHGITITYIMCVCRGPKCARRITWPKKRMLKVSLGRLKQTCDTHVIHYYYYARAALAWTKKKRSLRNRKLNARKEMQRIRRENKKTENHE